MKASRTWVASSLLVAAAFLPPTTTAGAASLTTQFNANTGGPGVMFDVELFGSDLTITQVDINLDSAPFDLELHTRSGTFVGHEGSSAGWTLRDSTSSLSGAGFDNVTAWDIADFTLGANQAFGFYVTTAESSGGPLNYTSGSSIGAVAAANGDLQILEGRGQKYGTSGFDGPVSSDPRIFNGTIHYTVVPEPAAVLLTLSGVSALTVLLRRRSK